MVAAPAKPPVTIPNAVTEATDVLLLLHVPPVTASLKVTFEVLQTDDAPVMAIGKAITVTDVVAALPQPVEYVIVAVPAIPPVTTPDAFTVATNELLLLHVPPVTASLKVVFDVAHTDKAPDIAPGAAITVIVLVASVPQPVE